MLAVCNTISTMAAPTVGPPQHILDLQMSLQYKFVHLRYLVEALRAPGSGYTNPQADQQGNDGYRRLAQLGDSLLRTMIIDDGYVCNKDRGKSY